MDEFKKTGTKSVIWSLYLLLAAQDFLDFGELLPS
jgi:hypothetical protein